MSSFQWLSKSLGAELLKLIFDSCKYLLATLTGEVNILIIKLASIYARKFFILLNIGYE